MQISVILPSRTCQMCLCLALRGLGFGRDLNTSEVSCWQHQLHKLNPKPLRPTSWSTAMSNSSHQPWSSWKILRDPQEVSLKFLFVTHASLCLCVFVCVCVCVGDFDLAEWAQTASTLTQITQNVFQLP